MSYANVGRVWTLESFREYLKGVKRPAYVKSVTIHHTGAPSLAQRPHGFLAQHLLNIKSYYQSLGWNRGPHLFVDEDQIFGMTPLNVPGIHAVSFNRNSIGIEILGDYDSEDPLTGRGLACMKNTAAVTKALFEWLDMPVNENTLKFHRDDPKTSKTCPGKKVKKDWFISLVQSSADKKTPVTPIFTPPTDLVPLIDYVVKHKGYEVAAASKLLVVKNGMTTFNGAWIESARYDSKSQTTLALQHELNADIQCINKV
jgi:hypothetical protein